MNLYRQFTPYLIRPPLPELVWRIFPPKCISSPKCWHYGMDGKWLHRERVCLLHRDVTNHETIWWSFPLTESESAMRNDLAEISKLVKDDTPEAAVTDWKRPMRRTIIESFGPIPHQRCLVHVTRQAYRLLPERSPIPATQRLRDHAQALLSVMDKQDEYDWKSRMTSWGYQYGDLLQEKTIAPPGGKKKWWYTHGNLRRGWRLLTTDTDAFFVFLSVKNLPSTANSIEGVNRHITSILEIHRGLIIPYQISLISWMLAFSRTKSEDDLHRLWDIWKTTK